MEDKSFKINYTVYEDCYIGNKPSFGDWIAKKRRDKGFTMHGLANAIDVETCVEKGD